MEKSGIDWSKNIATICSLKLSNNPLTAFDNVKMNRNFLDFFLLICPSIAIFHPDYE